MLTYYTNSPKLVIVWSIGCSRCPDLIIFAKLREREKDPSILWARKSTSTSQPTKIKTRHDKTRPSESKERNQPFLTRWTREKRWSSFRWKRCNNENKLVNYKEPSWPKCYAARNSLKEIPPATTTSVSSANVKGEKEILFQILSFFVIHYDTYFIFSGLSLVVVDGKAIFVIGDHQIWSHHVWRQIWNTLSLNFKMESTKVVNDRNADLHLMRIHIIYEPNPPHKK